MMNNSSVTTDCNILITKPCSAFANIFYVLTRNGHDDIVFNSHL